MSKKNYKDFDAFFAELRARRGKDRKKFKLGGKIYELPPELPAIVPILAARMGDQDANPSNILEISEYLFGKDQLDGVLASGISIDELGELIGWAIESYIDDTNVTDDTGAPPKNQLVTQG